MPEKHLRHFFRSVVDLDINKIGPLLIPATNLETLYLSIKVVNYEEPITIGEALSTYCKSLKEVWVPLEEEFNGENGNWVRIERDREGNCTCVEEDAMLLRFSRRDM